MIGQRTSYQAIAAVALFEGALCASPALADDSRSETILDAPAPPTLPALAHRELVYSFEYTAATIDPGGGHGRVYAYLEHNEVELPLVPRRWYIGAAADVGAGSVPGVGSGFLLGNPELWGRGLWSSVLGLSSGGALGFVLPVPRQLTSIEHKVLEKLRVVRPWDVAYFDDLTFTLRPSFDIRHVTGGLILQLRQGIDASIPLRKLASDERRLQLTARATFYAGYRIAEPVGIGLELFEVYRLASPRRAPGDERIDEDRGRAAVSISPSVRFILPRVQPALSLLFPIATPLGGTVESYFGARLNVGFTWDLLEPAAVGTP